MRSHLYWLSDEQWARIEPLLPTDVRGKKRVPAAVGAICRLSMVRIRQSIIALFAGRGAASGRTFFTRWPHVGGRDGHR